VKTVAPASLEDDVIELRLLRILEAGDLDARSPETRFLAKVPEIRYAIHRRTDGARVGRIHLRNTNDQTFLRTLGHSGYAVNENERRWDTRFERCDSLSPSQGP
jgi:predicted acetyltransferase